MMSKSKAVIGLWPLSGDFGQVGLRTICDALENCAKLGFQEFDVAPNYGNGFMESCLGNVFGSDENILINTKCGNHPFDGKDFDVMALEKSLDQSLKRLRRDRIHALFLHNPRTELTDFSSAIAFLEKEKKQNRIKLYGLSAAKDYCYDDKLCSCLDVIQDDVNILYLKAIQTRAHPCHYFYARSVLATGILSGRLTRDTVFDPSDYRSSWLKGDRLNSIIKRLNVIRSLTSISLPSLARRFVLQLPQVDKVIFGIKKTEHLRDIMTDLEADPLPEELMQSLIRMNSEDFGLQRERHLGF